MRKACDSKEKHDAHEWYEKNIFRRECPGRKRKAKR